MFAEQINAAGGVKGKKVEMLFYDTASNPENAVTDFKKFTSSDKVDAIVGLGLINEAMAVIPMVKSGPIVYSL